MPRNIRRTEKVRRTVTRETTERTEEIREDFPFPLTDRWTTVVGELDAAGEPIGDGMWIRRAAPEEIEEQRRAFARPHIGVVIDARDNYRFMRLGPSEGAAGAAAAEHFRRLRDRVGPFLLGGWIVTTEPA